MYAQANKVAVNAKRQVGVLRGVDVYAKIGTSLLSEVAEDCAAGDGGMALSGNDRDGDLKRLLPRAGSAIVRDAIAALSDQRIQPVCVSVTQKVGYAQGMDRATLFVNHGNYGDTTEAYTDVPIHVGNIETAEVHRIARAVKATVPGLTPAEADRISNAIGGVEDQATNFTGLYLRIMALWEAVSYQRDLIGLGNAPNNQHPRVIWPKVVGGGAAAQAANVPYDGFIEDVESCVDGVKSVVVLNSRTVNTPLTPEGMAVLWLACQPNCGVAPQLGPNVPGVAGRLRGALRLYVVGVRGRPNTVNPIGAVTLAAVKDAFRFVEECTGDGGGIAKAYHEFARMVCFAGPEFSELAVPVNRRFNLTGQVLSTLNIWWLFMRRTAGTNLTIVESDTVRAQSNAATGGHHVLGGAGNIAAPADVAVPGRGTPEAIAAAAFNTWDEFITLAPSELVIRVSTHIVGWNVCGALGAAVVPGAYAPVAAGAQPCLNNVRCELNMPADGLYGTRYIPCCSGLTAFQQVLASQRAPPARASGQAKTLLINNTAQAVISQLYLLASMYRTAADVAARATSLTPAARNVLSGLMSTDDPAFDAWYQSWVAPQFTISEVDTMSATVVHQQVVSSLMGLTSIPDLNMHSLSIDGTHSRPDWFIQAAYQPVLSTIVHGVTGGVGGMLSVQKSRVMAAINAGDAGIMGCSLEGMCEQDRVGFIAKCEFMRCAKSTFSRRVRAVDPETGEMRAADVRALDMPMVRYSDSFVGRPHLAACAASWYADGLTAVWVHTPQEVQSRWRCPANHAMGGGTAGYAVVERRQQTLAVATYCGLALGGRGSGMCSRGFAHDAAQLAPLAAGVYVASTDFVVAVLDPLPVRLLATSMMAAHALRIARVEMRVGINTLESIKLLWARSGGTVPAIIERMAAANSMPRSDAAAADRAASGAAVLAVDGVSPPVAEPDATQVSGARQQALN
jgi:hypothetical protein